MHVLFGMGETKPPSENDKIRRELTSRIVVYICIVVNDHNQEQRCQIKEMEKNRL